MPIALTGGTVSRPMPCQRFAPFAGGALIGFQFTIDAGGGLHQFTLPLKAAGTYNFDVDWGDGNTDTITTWNQAQATHTYASDANYQITISGTMTHFGFDGTGDCLKMISIDRWADTGLVNMDGFCQGCSNLTSVAATGGWYDTFTSAIAYVLSARLAFANCTSLTTLPSGTEGIFLNSCTDFTSFLESCTSLTDAGYIEVGASITLDRMYFGCTSLATLNSEMQHFGSHATTMIEMFKNCTSLTTIPSNVFDYGVDFTSMFEGCTAFNGFANVGIKASATTLNSMCWACSSMTSATPRAGSDMTGVTSATNMFNGGCAALTSISLGFGTGANDLTGIVSGCSALTNFSLGNITNDIDLTNCPILSGAEMNTIFSSLNTAAHTITITGTPVTTQTGCTPSTATGKGWTVVQNAAVAENPAITDMGGSVRFNFGALGLYAAAHSQIEYQVNSGGYIPTTDGGSVGVSSGDFVECHASDVNSAGTDGGFMGYASYTVP